MNDVFQVDYLLMLLNLFYFLCLLELHAKKIIINLPLPEEVWKNIDTVIMTRQFQEELVVEKQEESEVKKDDRKNI